MALEYTEEKLNSLDRETLIQLFLSQQEQLKQIDHNLQLVPEQMADLKRNRFGRSTEKIVFFNESEAVVDEESVEEAETVSRRKPKK